MAAITEPTAALPNPAHAIPRPVMRPRSCEDVAQAHDEEDGEDQRHQHPVP